MALGEYKTKLIEKKKRIMIQLAIEPYEIIIMVIYTWDCSFGRIMSNKKMNIDWGWYPLNRQPLLYPTLRSTMTIEEKDHEEASGIVISRPASMPTSNEFLPIPTLSQEFLHPPLAPSSQVQPLKFSNGVSA